FAGINIVSSAFFSSISKAKQGMIISILRSALILIPAVLLLSIFFKMDGIWYSFVITELAVVIINSIFLQDFKLRTSQSM
ncbi:MAG TPA: MATE family efflux transporter, partial [Terrisporobacter glycolicus]|nr:MATE family efflux transporter [Terrisporobacter hibernicus]